MEVNNGIWRTISAFYYLAGGWLFRVWILTMLAGVIPLGLAVFGVTESEREFWWIALAFGYLILPLVGFHLVRIERDEFGEMLDPKSVSEVLDPLIAEGARIRIDGRVFLSKESVDKWVEESALEWTWRTHAILQEIQPAAAPNFRTLHDVDAELPEGYEPFNYRHEIHLRMLTQRTNYLKDLMRQ